jgi:hypothetical protein
MGNKNNKLATYNVWFIEERTNILETRTGMYIEPNTEFAKKLNKIRLGLKKDGYNIDEGNGKIMNRQIAEFYVGMIDKPNIKKLLDTKMQIIKSSYEFSKQRFSFSPDNKRLLYIFDKIDGELIYTTIAIFKNNIDNQIEFFNKIKNYVQ